MSEKCQIRKIIKSELKWNSLPDRERIFSQLFFTFLYGSDSLFTIDINICLLILLSVQLRLPMFTLKNGDNEKQARKSKGIVGMAK